MDEDVRKQSEVALQLAIRSANLVGHCTLALSKAGAIPGPMVQQCSENLREVARVLDDHDAIEGGGSFWAAAQLLEDNEKRRQDEGSSERPGSPGD
jgi:hypothetical protein